MNKKSIVLDDLIVRRSNLVFDQMIAHNAIENISRKLNKVERKRNELSKELERMRSIDASIISKVHIIDELRQELDSGEESLSDAVDRLCDSGKLPNNFKLIE